MGEERKPFVEVAQTSTGEQLPSNGSAARTEVYYRPELDALRFFAFSLVFIHHIPFHGASFVRLMQAGAFGLPIFFCLSAYLIVTLLLKEKDRTGTVRLRWFAIRRILRIWPLYFGILGLGWLMGRFWPAMYLSGKEILAFTVMLGNVWMLRHGWNQSPAAIVWSISIEEQFYLGVPFLVRVGGRRGILLCCLVVLIVAYVALILIHQHGGDPLVAPWSNSFVQFQFFAAGGLLALIYQRWRIQLSLWIRLGLFAGSLCAYAVAAPISVSYSGRALVAGYLLALIGTTGILVATLNLPVSPPSALIYLGRISYGLYVFHMTMLWVVFGSFSVRLRSYAFAHLWQGVSLAFLLTILCATISYHYMEMPILRFKERFRIIQSSPA